MSQSNPPAGFEYDPSQFPCLTHRDDLTRLTLAVEHLTKEMSELNSELREMKDEHLAPLITEVAITKIKLERISWVVYGCVGAVAVQVLGVGGSLIFWAITTRI